MLNINHLLAALLSMGLISPVCAQVMPRKSDPYDVVTDKKVDALVRRSSQELNMQLPLVIDSRTRIDTSLVGPGRRFIYLLTFTYPSSRSETAADLTGSKIRSSVCSTAALKLLLDNDYLIIYKYFDIDGRFIGDVTVNRGDCQVAPDNAPVVPISPDRR